MLDEVLLTLKLERAIIFVKDLIGWRVASAHEIPTKNFWTVAPISLTVVQSVALEGKPVNIVDAGDSDFAGRESVILTGLRSVACVPVKNPMGETVAMLYADNRLETGAFSPADFETLIALGDELANRLFPDPPSGEHPPTLPLP